MHISHSGVVCTLQALMELRASSTTGRPFNLVEVEVTLAELTRAREESVSGLLAPSANTVLDDGIGCALWFAARGAGRLRENASSPPGEEGRCGENSYRYRSTRLQ